MKTLRWAIASSLVGALFAGTAMAQVTMSSPVQQPGSIQQMAFQRMIPLAMPQPIRLRPRPAAVTPASPSNQPPAPPAVKAEEKPAAEKPKEEEEGRRKERGREAGRGRPVQALPRPLAGLRTPRHPRLPRSRLHQQPDCPLSGFNGPDGYNDLSNQGVLDQLYLIAERVAKVDNDCGVDYGYRADVMFGTDAHFVQTTPGTLVGQHVERRQSLLRPGHAPVVGTLQYNKLTLQGGHFYAPCGYENAMPTENFFYSHTYKFLYGKPTTLTGGYGDLQAQGQALGQRRS